MRAKVAIKCAISAHVIPTRQSSSAHRCSALMLQQLRHKASAHRKHYRWLKALARNAAAHAPYSSAAVAMRCSEPDIQKCPMRAAFCALLRPFIIFRIFIVAFYCCSLVAFVTASMRFHLNSIWALLYMFVCVQLVHVTSNWAVCSWLSHDHLCCRKCPTFAFQLHSLKVFLQLWFFLDKWRQTAA